ncbi:MAG: hypothetical protein MUC50_08425 [Myxococcota bacterium]|jgi:hypothetical protein|nr:hypothetical protein [Myxococcota bacterium]
MSKQAYEFNNSNPNATVLRRLDPMVIEKPRAPIHIHTYGGETPFFKGLTEGRLMATKCANGKCDPSGKEGYFHLPPRVYCPDCSEKMEWHDVTDLARRTAKVHTHITVERPGAFNRVPMPCELISVEIEGVATVIMSQLRGAKPEIGMPIQPEFNTTNPTFTILDLSWVPRR